MVYKIEQLKKVMDDTIADPALVPIERDGMITTFCNLAAFRIAQDLGCNLFWCEEKDRPMLANEAITYMDAHPERASKFYDPATAWYLADTGHLVFAGIKDTPHGHIAAIYPGMGLVKSAKWRNSVPHCANVGRENKIMGLNWAFRDMPAFYIV